MKRKMYFVIGGLSAALLLGGCGASKKSDSGNADAGVAQAGEEQTDSADGAGEAAAGSEGTENAADGAEVRELTAAELQKFSDWINEGDNGGNYGFLLSDYRKPKDADLGEIFYSGAGIATDPLTEAEQQEYLKISGREDIETDCVRLTTEQINRVLTKRLGCTLDEMSQELPWFYLEKAKVWVTVGGGQASDPLSEGLPEWNASGFLRAFGGSDPCGERDFLPESGLVLGCAGAAWFPGKNQL